jgi:hypothetical protein
VTGLFGGQLAHTAHLLRQIFVVFTNEFTLRVGVVVEHDCHLFPSGFFLCNR